MRREYRIGYMGDEYETYSDIGLQVKSLPDSEFSGPMTVAHDIFEHTYIDGSAESELFSLGAAYYNRYLSSGSYNRMHYLSPNQLVGFVTEICEYMAKKLITNQVPYVRTKRVYEVEEFANTLINRGVREFCDPNFGYTDNFDVLPDFSFLLKNGKGHIRQGYRWACRQYERNVPDIFLFYRRTQDLVQGILNDLTEMELSWGDCIINFSPKKRKVVCYVKIEGRIILRGEINDSNLYDKSVNIDYI